MVESPACGKRRGFLRVTGHSKNRGFELIQEYKPCTLELPGQGRKPR
uniref:Uncharacterized protein n=1 Tax=Siphoviridae sp. ct6bU4 TaxID=2825344 RepID=A0A8S5VAG4_9CAUD|nr:MAG TPA: hypothetical protein [Siphoviridae sp. ct6bU4]